jgi:hypothetical protein
LQLFLLFLDCGFPDTPPEEPAVHLIVRLQEIAMSSIKAIEVRLDVEDVPRSVGFYANTLGF